MIKEIRLCDMCLPGKEVKLSGDRQPISFSYDGEAQEIDLCPKHETAFNNALGQFIEHARRIKASTVRPFIRDSRGKRERVRPKEIRRWAESQGITVNSHGRIPVDIVERYDREAVLRW